MPVQGLIIFTAEAIHRFTRVILSNYLPNRSLTELPGHVIANPPSINTQIETEVTLYCAFLHDYIETIQPVFIWTRYGDDWVEENNGTLKIFVENACHKEYYC